MLGYHAATLQQRSRQPLRWAAGAGLHPTKQRVGPKQETHLAKHDIHCREQHAQAFLGRERTAAQQQSQFCCDILNVLDAAAEVVAQNRCTVISR